MSPDEFMKQLAVKLNELRENVESVHKKIQHEIAQLKVMIGPDEWNESYRIAAYLALKNVIDETEEDNEFDFE